MTAEVTGSEDRTPEQVEEFRRAMAELPPSAHRVIEAPPRQLASFEFTCDGAASKGVPVVNGHKILSASQIDVHLDAESLPEVTLRLSASDAVKLGFAASVVKLDDGTCEALVSLGWTPPPGPAADGSDADPRSCGTNCDC